MTQARLLGGRYQVGELLGYGGMAEVHRGRDLRLGRDVAIKLLRTDLARDDTFQLRFRREAQNAAALNHPAIVAVYDTGEERGATGESLPFIVMEFVNGRTLKEVLTAEGRLQPRRALEITAEICNALDFSHRHGIIHRDIKPGNVMLTQTGQVKVMDFGIARALASGASTMTQTSAVIGTAQYLSPEQARGESVDARSDVYAAGCVLYELLVGQPPFVGDSPVAVAYQHVREEPKAPSMSNRDVSPPLDAVVLKALAKNPLNRYQSAGEMRADVLRAAAGRPVQAEPVMRGTDTATAPFRPGLGGLRPGRAGERRRPPTSGWAIAGLTALAVLAVVALVAGLIASQQPDKVTVPTVMGKTNEQARAALVAARLVADSEAVNGVDCGPINRVIEQEKVGAKVDVNTKIHYKWCAGPAARTVPELTGKDKATADSILTGLNLKASFEVVDSEKPVDTVVDSTPPAGSQATEGDTITVRLSNGKLKAVPDVRGGKYSQAEAIGILNFQGWKYSVTTVNTTDPAMSGKVIDQDPEPGVLKDPTKVTITLFVGQLEVPPSDTGSPSPS